MKKFTNAICLILILTINTSCETAEDRYQIKGEQYLNQLKSIKIDIDDSATVDSKTIKEKIHEYNTIQDSIQAIYYNLKADLLINILNEKDFVKSILVLKILNGHYKGGGGIFSYSPSWGTNFRTGGISTELYIGTQQNSIFARKAMDGGKNIPIEIFDITIKNIKHLDENLISGEVFHKRDNYWVCNFEFKNKILRLISEYNNGNWESINRPVTKESLEFLK